MTPTPPAQAPAEFSDRLKLAAALIRAARVAGCSVEYASPAGVAQGWGRDAAVLLDEIAAAAVRVSIPGGVLSREISAQARRMMAEAEASSPAPDMDVGDCDVSVVAMDPPDNGEPDMVEGCGDGALDGVACVGETPLSDTRNGVRAGVSRGGACRQPDPSKYGLALAPASGDVEQGRVDRSGRLTEDLPRDEAMRRLSAIHIAPTDVCPAVRIRAALNSVSGRLEAASPALRATAERVEEELQRVMGREGRVQKELEVLGGEYKAERARLSAAAGLLSHGEERVERLRGLLRETEEEIGAAAAEIDSRAGRAGRESSKAVSELRAAVGRLRREVQSMRVREGVLESLIVRMDREKMREEWANR